MSLRMKIVFFTFWQLNIIIIFNNFFKIYNKIIIINKYSFYIIIIIITEQYGSSEQYSTVRVETFGVVLFSVTLVAKNLT